MALLYIEKAQFMRQTEDEKKKIKILIADDDQGMADVVMLSAKKVGYETHVVTDSVKAKKLLEEVPFDVLLTDLRMPEIGGMELVKTALEIDQTIKVIIITGDGSKDDAVKAVRFGVYDFLDKPFSMTRLETILRNAMALKNAEKDREELLLALKELTSP